MGKRFGLGLLNEQSKASSSMSLDDRFEITYIELEDLHDNPRNAYLNMDSVKELADEIMKVGMLQNLVVRPREGGGYVLLAGHRRKAANAVAYEKTGKEKYRRLPCIIRDPAELVLLDNDGKRLEISDELKEELCIASTNFHQRKYTPMETAKMLEVYRKIYGQVAEQSINEDTGEKIAVGKEREFIAAQMQVSEAVVQRMDYITSHASDELLDQYRTEQISTRAAYELSKQSQPMQDEILSYFGETAPTVQEIKDYVDAPMPPESEEEAPVVEQAPQVAVTAPVPIFTNPVDPIAAERREVMARIDQMQKMLTQLQRKNKHLAGGKQEEWTNIFSTAIDRINAINQFLIEE